jgi:hypothetical protein
MFKRLHHATGDEIFATAARRWVDHAVASLSEPLEVVSLLQGMTGIALAIHAMTSEIEPAWDQVLLADIGPPD